MHIDTAKGCNINVSELWRDMLLCESAAVHPAPLAPCENYEFGEP